MRAVNHHCYEWAPLLCKHQLYWNDKHSEKSKAVLVQHSNNQMKNSWNTRKRLSLSIHVSVVSIEHICTYIQILHSACCSHKICSLYDFHHDANVLRPGLFFHLFWFVCGFFCDKYHLTALLCDCLCPSIPRCVTLKTLKNSFVEWLA